MQHNICTALWLDGLFHCVLRRTVAWPVNGFGVLLVREGEYLHFVCNHEGRVETQTEVTDNGFCFVFVFIHKLFCTRESDLVDILIHLLGCHTDTVVLYGKGLFLFINKYAHACVTQLAFGFAYGGEGFQFLGSIYRITNQLTEKNLVVRIQKFLDDGEDIIWCYPDISFLAHKYILFC